MDAPLAAMHIERMRQMLRRWMGFEFDEGKSGTLAELLLRRAETMGLTVPAYLDRLEGPHPPHSELTHLVEELTVTETSFFRNADQMRAFEQTVIPDRVEARGSARKLRILSAGCASGEEPYSLAIIAQTSPYLAGWDVDIRALDINPAVLRRAAAAHYSPWSLRQTPAAIRARFFRSDGRDHVLNTDIREMVTFAEFNLVAEDNLLWAPNSFDVVFCRNVVMYFAPEIARQVIARIARSLAPGGFLFLGHAETLRGLSNDFHLCHVHDTFFYQRKDGLEAGYPLSATSMAPRIGEWPSDAVANLDDSWVETIARASARVHALTGKPNSTLKTSAHGPDLAVALDLLTRERFSEARAVLGALPAEMAQNPEVLLLHAVLATHGGDLSGAEKLSVTLLSRDEMNAGAHYILALCRESAGDIAGASQHDRTAVYLDPGFAMPRLHLGLLARRAGDLGTARAELQQAHSLLTREEPSRLLLFGGGFGREALIALCCAELASCEGKP
jgi:chemotaxis protein methyltransferase CheR